MNGSQSSPSSHPETDLNWMRKAITLAEEAGRQGEVPVGAILVRQNIVIAEAHNSPVLLHDPTAHAEILALRRASIELQNYRLPQDTTLYVTLEPCIMCMGALIQARVSRLVYGASDPKTGAASSIYSIGSDGHLNHEIEISSGVLTEQCGALLRDFFRVRRVAKKQLKNS